MLQVLLRGNGSTDVPWDNKCGVPALSDLSHDLSGDIWCSCHPQHPQGLSLH